MIDLHPGALPLRVARLLSLVVLFAAAPGCAWLRDRGADAADILTVEVGAGVGIHADAKATDYLHLGLGYAHVRKAGLRGRDVEWLRDREVGLPIAAIVAVGAWRDGHPERLLHQHLSAA